jgi:hypothetical protein
MHGFLIGGSSTQRGEVPFAAGVPGMVRETMRLGGAGVVLHALQMDSPAQTPTDVETAAAALHGAWQLPPPAIPEAFAYVLGQNDVSGGVWSLALLLADAWKVAETVSSPEDIAWTDVVFDGNQGPWSLLTDSATCGVLQWRDATHRYCLQCPKAAYSRAVSRRDNVTTGNSQVELILNRVFPAAHASGSMHITGASNANPYMITVKLTFSQLYLNDLGHASAEESFVWVVFAYDPLADVCVWSLRGVRYHTNQL